MTISYAAVTAAERYRVALFAVTAAAVVLGGSLVYRDAIVSRAENRFHLSQVMIDVANTVLTHRDADEDTAIGVCLPPEFVQQVRQYDGRFYMPFGRAEVHWGYTGNLAYNLYTAEVIDMEELDAELRRRSIPYLVISDAKSVSLSPAQKGWEEIAALHGYRVWCRKAE